jgi:DNA-binding beta-propeller fold protein YncE
MHFRFLCVDKYNDVVLSKFVEEYEANLIVYDQHGEVVRRINEEALNAIACTADTRGRLFVSKHCSGDVSIYSPTADDEPAEERPERNIRIRPILGAGGLALSLDESILYVTGDYMVCCVRAYQVDTGAFIRNIGVGHLQHPTGVVALTGDRIAVSSCVDAGTVHIFAADGSVLRSFGAGALKYPSQIAADADDNLYVANQSAHNVVVYSSADGSVLHSFGTKGRAAGQFKYPSGIAVDSAGTIIVADKKRVQFFKAAPCRGRPKNNKK